MSTKVLKSPMLLLRSEDDFSSHKTSFTSEIAKAMTISPVDIQWGTAPQDYPVLACSLFVDAVSTVYTCKIYPANAAVLMEAAGVVVRVPSQEAKEPISPPEKAPTPASSDRIEFDINTLSTLLTLVHFALATGLCKKQQFLEVHSRFVAELDQDVKSRLDALERFISCRDKTLDDA